NAASVDGRDWVRWCGCGVSGEVKTMTIVREAAVVGGRDGGDVKRIFRYLKGKPHFGLWYPKDSLFNLVAYLDSDYAGASLDRKSTTRGCQFLGCRLISWQCKKQTVVATSSTEAEYVAAASCCAQVLWIQNQLLDYGLNVTAVSSKFLLFDASEGFDQIIDFLNASSIKYALTVNLNIYVSCIKQFWTSVSVKKVNDVTRLQALVDKKKVIIIEATIRDALRLDDAEIIDYLPNEEIFTALSRMWYEKPSTKLNFYKAFFSPQWKFLIHTILQCMSTKRTLWNEFNSSMASAVIYLSTGRKFNFSKYIFDRLVRNVDSSTKFYMYPRFLQLMIRAQVGDLSSHSTKYSSSALIQKVFANMRRVGKRFLGVDTPLFEGIIVAQQVDENAAEVNVDDVPAAGVADEGTASVNVDDVLAAVDEPFIPSPLPTTQPPLPLQDIPSTSQVQPTPPPSPIAQSPSPQQQPQSLQDAKSSMDLLHTLLETCTTLTRRERIIASMDTDVDVTLKDVVDIAKEVAANAEIEESADVQGSMQDIELEPAELQEVVEVVTTAKLITKVVIAASATITTADTSIPAAIITATAPTLTTAPSAARRRKGVVIRDPEETATPSTIIHSEAKSKDKRKGILVEEPKPLKKQAQIEKNEAFARELEAE
nr:uncharacterized mitochondrial protein AtMg00810-like [Tanacetum cinerariifolium]